MKLVFSAPNVLPVSVTLILLSRCGTVVGQNAIVSGSLRGTISDATKAVVLGAVVRVTNQGMGDELVVRSVLQAGLPA